MWIQGNRAEVSWAESAVQGYHDVGQPAHDGRSHFSGGSVEGTAAPTPAWSVPWCRRAWLARLLAPGQGLDPVAVVVNQPSVPSDSSSTLSPGWCVTLLLPILLAARARLCRGAGWGVREAGWKHE